VLENLRDRIQSRNFGYVFKIFHEIDRNHDNQLSIDEFRVGLENLNWRMTDQEAREIFEEFEKYADRNHDHKIDFPEYFNFLRDARWEPKEENMKPVTHSSVPLTAAELSEVARENGLINNQVKFKSEAEKAAFFGQTRLIPSAVLIERSTLTKKHSTKQVAQEVQRQKDFLREISVHLPSNMKIPAGVSPPLPPRRPAL
jgi:hypothetical protein